MVSVPSADTNVTALAPGCTPARSRMDSIGMPFTFAVTMARPPAGLPPQVHVIFCCTDSSPARSPTEAV